MASGFFLILFGTVFLLLLCCFYAASRILGLFPLKKRRTWSALAGILMLLLFMLGFGRSMVPMSAALRRILGTASAYWMGVFLYLIFCFVISDAAVLLGRLFRVIPRCAMKKARRIAGAIALALALAVSGYGFFHAQDVQTKEYEIALADETGDAVVIALVSDLHLGAAGSEARLPGIVAAINEAAPDLVLLSGDIFDNDFSAIADPDRAAELLRQIDAPLGAYACLGNHDSGSSFPQMLGFLEDCGIVLLADEWVSPDGRFALAGRLDPSPIGGNGMARRATREVLDGIPDGMPVVVLDHNPANIREYDGIAHLILSGHTHRGQVWPGELITRALYAVDYGYYRAGEDCPHVIVTSGAGTWGPPMRVGTDSEVVKITLYLP